jgi:RIO kinase 1
MLTGCVGVRRTRQVCPGEGRAHPVIPVPWAARTTASRRIDLEVRVSVSATYEDALADFFEDDLVTDVVRVLKSGKEGTVYCCRAASRTGQEFLAAKVYRSPEHRLFHNSAVYQEGRWIGDKRLRRAVANKSRAGREVQSDMWVGHEYETLKLLHGAGAAVPEAFARSGQALLMTYVGDLEAAAPMLQHAEIPPGLTESLFRRLLGEIELWLDCGRVHADLSPFNVLYWEGQVTVIDFPQAVDPETNGNARELLTRDVANVCRYFARHGIRADAEAVATGIWRQSRWRDW